MEECRSETPGKYCYFPLKMFELKALGSKTHFQATNIKKEAENKLQAFRRNMQAENVSKIGGRWKSLNRCASGYTVGHQILQ